MPFNSSRVDDLYLSGKVALVTGASRGIGRSIALRLSALGAALALTARDEEQLRAVIPTLSQNAGAVTSHLADLREPSSAAMLVEEVLGQHGKIDILINNAGGSVAGSFTELADAAWTEAFDLKLFGGMRVTRAAWPALIAQKGAVINIIGVAGRTVEPRSIVAATQCSGYYALTKALAALGLTEGVQVNAINPGPVWTDRLKGRLTNYGIDPALPEERILALLAEKMNLRRIGRPEDIADLVAFILSSAGGLFHGALIDFDGGAVRSL